jgi:hypothetical protein
MSPRSPLVLPLYHSGLERMFPEKPFDPTLVRWFVIMYVSD